MSVSNWLTSVATIQRNTPTADSMGGQTDSWASYTWNDDTGASTANVKCLRTPLFSSHLGNLLELGRPDAIRAVNWVFGQDYGCKVGDRISWTNPRGIVEYYSVTGPGVLYFAPSISKDQVYSVTTMLKEF